MGTKGLRYKRDKPSNPAGCPKEKFSKEFLEKKVKPGEVRNPHGINGFTSKKSVFFSKMTKEKVQETLSQALKMTLQELQDKIKDPNTNSLELMTYSIVRESIKGGDYTRFNFLLDRTIGRVKDEVEVTSPRATLIRMVDSDLALRLSNDPIAEVQPLDQIAETEAKEQND